MGTDIHLFLEYDVGAIPGNRDWIMPALGEPPPAFSQQQHIRAFAEDRFHIPRDYHLFAALAGVRWHDERPRPLHPPRGFPRLVAPDVMRRYFHYVLDEGETRHSEDEETRENAERYVAAGHSSYRDTANKPKALVSDADWHTPSWLTAGEFRASLAIGGISDDVSFEVSALMIAADELERHCGAGRCRMVFWFDN